MTTKTFSPKVLIKVFAFVLAFSLVTSFLFFSDSSSVETAWDDKYEDQQAEVQSQIKNIRDELGSVGSTIGELGERKNNLKEEIATIEQEIAKTETLITETKVAISIVENQIEQKEAQIKELKKQLRNLIRDIQRQDSQKPLELILSSGTLGEAIGKVHDLSAISVQFDNIRAETEQAKTDLEDNRKMLEETENTLEEVRALNASKKDSLELLLQKTKGEESKYQSLLASLKTQEQQLKAESSKIEQQRDAEEKRLEEERRKREEEERRREEEEGGGTPSPPQNCVNESFRVTGIPSNYFADPAGGYITQRFGCVPYLNGAHDGIDVANGRGTVIKAAADGKVIKSGYAGGYGYRVVIKHSLSSGRRLYTTYAHMNSTPPVSVGQNIKKGQAVGYMGTTGYSTGVHLHFSIADESYEATGNTNCNPRYGSTSTYCYDPVKAPFNMF